MLCVLGSITSCQKRICSSCPLMLKNGEDFADWIAKLTGRDCVCTAVGSLVVFFARFQVPKIGVVLGRHGFDSPQKSRYQHPYDLAARIPTNWPDTSKNGRTAAQAKMRLRPVVIEENERWRMRADGRVVPLAGIEPALLAELDFESSASTSSATGAFRAQPEGWGREAGGLYRARLAGQPARIHSTRIQLSERPGRRHRSRGGCNGRCGSTLSGPSSMQQNTPV
jgi:hypothetical protein